MLDQFKSYVLRFVDGEVPYQEFSQAMFLLRDMVEDVNCVLDGTCTLRDEAAIRQLVMDQIKNYLPVAVGA